MALLAEQYIPYVTDNKGYTTKKPITLLGAANFDASGSTGTFKLPSGVTSGLVSQVVDVTAATATLTVAQSGATILLDVATTTVTLPVDTVGVWYNFVVVTAATAQKVIINSASSFFVGNLDVPVSTGTRKSFFGDGSTLLSINLNGSTTGGLQGGFFSVECLKSGLWLAQGAVEGSGTVATPFATS